MSEDTFNEKDKSYKKELATDETAHSKNIVIDEAITAIREAINTGEKIVANTLEENPTKLPIEKKKPVLVLDKILIKDKIQSKKSHTYIEDNLSNEDLENKGKSLSYIEEKIKETNPKEILEDTINRELKNPLEEWIKKNLRVIVRDTVSQEIDLLKKFSTRNKSK